MAAIVLGFILFGSLLAVAGLYKKITGKDLK